LAQFGSIASGSVRPARHLHQLSGGYATGPHLGLTWASPGPRLGLAWARLGHLAAGMRTLAC